MSVASSSVLSSITVSAFGEDDMNLETAIDKAFNNIQQDLNYCHCSTRELLMDIERSESFDITLQKRYEIDDYISELSDLMKELQKIIKQIVRPINKDEKEYFKEQQDKRKKAKELKKIQDKEAKNIDLTQ
jgi:hypothetical protein